MDCRIDAAMDMVDKHMATVIRNTTEKKTVDIVCDNLAKVIKAVAPSMY
jgi:hypothetical protein